MRSPIATSGAAGARGSSVAWMGKSAVHLVSGTSRDYCEQIRSSFISGSEFLKGSMDSSIPQGPPPIGGGARSVRHYWRRNDEDIQKWAELFKGGRTILRIADQCRVSPVTVSQELHRLGFTVTPGHHMVEQLPLKYSDEFVGLVDKGPDHVLEFVRSRIWGINATEKGLLQLRTFCAFVKLHQLGVGVEEIARRLALHRTTVAGWREGTDQPYLVRAVSDTLPATPRDGWQLLPMRLDSGGGRPSGWIQVPQSIQSYSDVLEVIAQTRPLALTYSRAAQFGIAEPQIEALRPEFFAYLLGIMVGDAGKLGGEQQRYASMNLDLELTTKRSTNARLGEFVLMCVNSLGLEMGRKRDKQPSGTQLFGRDPRPAYRWASERSPVFAWIFSIGLGLKWKETTTKHQVRMPWIFDTPRIFRTRFVQGAADSDGCVKRYEIEIASVPNAGFFAKILQSLGLTSAHISYEKGEPLKTMVNRKQASQLPIFNEFVRSYRYQKMMKA